MQNVGHHIIKFLSLILFALVSITGEFAWSGTDFSGSVNPKGAVIRQHNPHKISISYQVGRTETEQPCNHIRIRYKASYLDCLLAPAVFVVRRSLPVYIARNYPEYAWLIISADSHVFSLRGPPSFLA